MTTSLVQDALELNLLLSPLAHALIKNFSFKSQFLSYCSSLPLPKNSIISWVQVKSFFESNNWNWKAFVLSNLPVILLEQGFLLSSSIDPHSIPIDDLQVLLDTLASFASTKSVFDTEMLSFLETNFGTSRNETTHSSSASSFPPSSVSAIQSVPESTPTGFLKPSLDSIFTQTVINDSISYATINLASITSPISLQTFQDFFVSRFQQLDRILKANNQDDKNRPAYPHSSKEIELNQRIFITGIVTQTALASTQLYSTKIQLENSILNCTIIASISIQQRSKIPFGMLVGIVGKVVDIEYLNNDKIILSISSEDWFYPEIVAPLKKTPPMNTNESWAVIIGSVNYSQSQFSINLITRFVKWLQTIHENFRISYALFIGGILSNDRDSHSFSNGSTSGNFSESFQSKYSSFNSLIEKIPSNIHTFIIPSSGDATNRFLPQPALSQKFHSSNDNIHYLQNPNVLNLEGKDILVYNPYQFFSHDLFLLQPEKFGIDLLTYRHLCPIWEENQNVVFPYSFDTLIIPDNIDFFVFNHPSQAILSNYKNINMLSVPVNDKTTTEDFSILIFNLHSQERKVIKIPLNS